MKTVGIIGSGDVGKALAIGFSSIGYEVYLGTRDPSKLESWKKDVDKNVKVTTFDQVGAKGQLLVLAVGWAHVRSAIKMTGAKNFAGKTLIDATNPLDFSAGFPPKLAVAGNSSGGEVVQDLLPKANVVKAFNIIGNAQMFRPSFVEGDPTMWICGNDEAAKAETRDILNEFGWKDVIDLGDITMSRLLEPLCILWVLSGSALKNWHIGFRLLQK